jgi:hypothetical protein
MCEDVFADGDQLHGSNAQLDGGKRVPPPLRLIAIS